MDGQHSLKRAVDYLAERCNYARTEDGAGFNKFDAEFGHRLAAIPYEHWSTPQRTGAYKMLRKYKAQLLRGGIDWDQIPDPETEPKPVIKTGKAPDRWIAEMPSGELGVFYPYDANIRSAISRLTDKHFEHADFDQDDDRQYERWECPWYIRNAQVLIDIACDYEFRVTDEIWDRLQDRAGSPLRYVKQIDGRYHVEYERDWVLDDKVQEIPGHRQETPIEKPGFRAWTLPMNADQAEGILDLVETYGFAIETGLRQLTEHIVQQRAAREKLSYAISADGQFEIPRLRGTLRPFQVPAVMYMVDSKRMILGDDMGTGKTIETIAAVEAANAYPAIVMCPPTVREQWVRAFAKWVPDLAANAGILYIEGSKLFGIEYDENGQPLLDANGVPVIGCVGDISPLAFLNPHLKVLVMGYTALHTEHAQMAVAILKNRPDDKLRAVICDESHYLKDGSRQRTRYAQEIAKGVEFRYCLTGTPIQNRTEELMPQLKLIDRLDDLGGATEYLKEYCGIVYDGPRRTRLEDFTPKLKDLNYRMRRSGIYMRRTKQEVLKDLPDKTVERLVVPLSNRDEYRKVEWETITWLKERLESDEALNAQWAMMDDDEAAAAKRTYIQGKVFKAAAGMQLAKFEYLRQVCARGKLQAAAEWIENFLEESTGKLVVYAHHAEVIDNIAAQHPGCAVIAGGDKNELRIQEIQRFTSDPACRLCVVSMRAAGTGTDGLQNAAQTALFLEPDWNPGIHRQCEDRLHRIGQKNACSYFYMTGEDCFDVDIMDLVEKKALVMDATVDGFGSQGNEQVTSELADRLFARARRRGQTF